MSWGNAKCCHQLRIKKLKNDGVLVSYFNCPEKQRKDYLEMLEDDKVKIYCIGEFKNCGFYNQKMLE